MIGSDDWNRLPENHICMADENLLIQVSPEFIPGHDIGFEYVNFVHLRDGKVKVIELKTSSDNYASLKRLLILRYGPPKSSGIYPVKTQAGSEFTTEKSEWVGKKVSVQLVQRSGTIDKSVVLVADMALATAEQQENQNREAKAASKF